MVIEKLKAKAGFGGAKLEISIPKEKYNLGETIEGEVFLSGGKVAQKITVLSISLIREWNWECYVVGRDMDYEPGFARGPYSAESVSVQSEYELDGDQGNEEVLKIQMGSDFETKPEEERRFSFSIDLSSIQREEGINEKWNLKARADIPFAKDATSEKTIDLVKPNKSAQQ